MQSVWGPRIFWLVVFILAGLGIFAYFYEPGDPDRFGYEAPLSNMVMIGPNIHSCQIQLSQPTQEPRNWKGEIKLGKGKILQLYPEHADPSSMFSATRFDCKPDTTLTPRRPVILHLVYQADTSDTLTVHIGDDQQKIPLTDIAIGKPPMELWAGSVKILGQVPVQFYENDSQTEDHSPALARDAQGADYLLYMNSERSKGIDVNAVLAGSFDSLENPIIGTTLRLCRFQDGAWQYSEAVTPKLETCLDPVVAVDATGRVFVAWAQKSVDGWDIFYQYKDYGPRGESVVNWSNPVKLTAKSGFVLNLVACTDSKGKVWLAWQTWFQDHCDIFAAVINDDKHFMKTPGPVAEHSRDDDGRWFPVMAADKLGNTYLAWTVFRQGLFHIEVMKLHENMVRSSPVQLAGDSVSAMRPSLVCDGENTLWVAFEEREAANRFGDFQLPASRIRVRALGRDGKLDEYPLLPAPAVASSGDAGKLSTVCTMPHLLLSKQGLPAVLFQSQHHWYLSHWQNDGWSAPTGMAHTQQLVQAGSLALSQHGHFIGIQENLDWKGRMRLQFCMTGEPGDAVKIPRKPAPEPQRLEVQGWKPFIELARQFRKRSDDLILSKRYLLRGLVVLPGAVSAMNADPWSTVCTSLEQSLYDWMLIPHHLQTPLAQQWRTAQRAHSLSFQEDRSMLLGYYRPMMGQREPLLLIDAKKDEMPLPPLAEFENLRKNSDNSTRISVSQTVDRSMITPYLSQRKRVGFSLTDDWRMMPLMTQPGNNEAYSDSLERLLLPFWRPETTPARPMPAALRVVTYALGKSHDYLLDSLRARNFYTATDDIYLLVRCDRHLPGDVFQTSFRPAINVTVQGTGKIKSVEIWQDTTLVKSETPPGGAAILEYVNDKDDRQWHSYTVRVVQENGAEAIAQPFWIRYVP